MAVMGRAFDSFAPVFRSDVNLEVRPHWYISFGLSSGVHLLVLVILLIISVLGPVRRSGLKGGWGVVIGGAFGQAYVSFSPSHQSHRTVGESGFGDKNANTSSGSKPDQTNSRPQFTAAEIIFKPTPAYTPEARSLRIEGEVVAEVLLSASGRAQTFRILQHFGHGLDESAAHTISEMRFKPAAENGRAVDSVVVIHILFKFA